MHLLYTETANRTLYVIAESTTYDDADYREDYIERENRITFYDELENLIYFFSKMNI
jgi:hypothetical protein